MMFDKATCSMRKVSEVYTSDAFVLLPFFLPELFFGRLPITCEICYTLSRSNEFRYYLATTNLT